VKPLPAIRASNSGVSFLEMKRYVDRIRSMGK
jgi:hypothetical protein